MKCPVYGDVTVACLGSTAPLSILAFEPQDYGGSNVGCEAAAHLKLPWLIAVCLGTVMSNEVQAFEPQDYGASTIVGEAVAHLHSVWAYNEQACGSLCQTYNTESSYIQLIFRTPDASPGVSETLTCDIPTTDASGNPQHGTTGDTPDMIMSYTHNADFLNMPGFDATHDNLNAGFAGPQIGGVLPMGDCNLTTDSLGKITGGWVMRVNGGTGLPNYYYSFYDFTDKKSLILGCSSYPAITDIRAITISAVAGGDNTSLPPGCTELLTYMDLNYLTCDIDQECGQFSKSVPVPAFAAAALGMGLVGVTFLVSARRGM